LLEWKRHFRVVFTIIPPISFNSFAATMAV